MELLSIVLATSFQHPKAPELSELAVYLLNSTALAPSPTNVCMHVPAYLPTYLPTCIQYIHYIHKYINTWVVVKIMVPLGVLSIIRHLIFRVPKKGP